MPVPKLMNIALNKFLFFTLLLHPLLSYGIDLLPNDIVAPVPDKRYVQITYYDTENTTYYKNGSVVATSPFGSPVVHTQSVIPRLVGTYTLANLPAASYIQLPYGNIQPAGSLENYPTTTGIGDISLATAIWPYVNRETRTYFGVAGFLTIPTGNYTNTQTFNLGENRFKTALQIGLQKAIVGNLDGMIAVDTIWYGGNSQCAGACGSATNVPLTQKPLTTIQISPVYKINQNFTVGASYFYVTGGATEINNVHQNNVINTQRFLLSGLAYTDFGRFALQYGRDMTIENGFIQTRVLAIRYMKQF
jgi:hypothetical protein